MSSSLPSSFSVRLFIPRIEQPVTDCPPHCQPGWHFKTFSIDVMMRDKAKSGGPTKQGKVKGVTLVDSPTRVAPLTGAKNLPPYGAQHHQDALWEGE
ncbi:hypothetical protein M405DRAFT_825235 [Rhizopogon salebrosus TDB-379]|nr:hypothetical protein M405DRAFT_825235 [Rhizopogon salebrosus TDB-379]